MKTIFAGASGTNTVDDPVRIGFDNKTGVSDLQYAVDVNVERNGRVSRRGFGSNLLVSGAGHSLWCDGGDAFLGKGTALYQILRDRTLMGIASNLSGHRIAYAQHGDRTYCSDWTIKWRIENSTLQDWPVHEYTGPDTSEVFSEAPVPRHMAVFEGRMFIIPVDDPNTVCWSESGGLFGQFSLVPNHRKLESTGIMILAVEAGLFISTERMIYFLRKVGANQFQLERKTTYPAVEWSERPGKVDGLKLGLETNAQCVLFRSTKGACIGTPDGQVINMTEKKIAQTNCGRYGASTLVGSYFIHSVGV